MTPDRWAEIDRIHNGALERPTADRPAYLDDACGGDASLRREVESLLAYATAAEKFLEQPAVPEALRLDVDADVRGDALPVVQGYHVLEVIGAGGMGIVYLAEQDPPLRRRVALKLIRPGLDSRNALARFEAERRALALMDHPNIAAVFGTGVAADGRPFVAMEFVAGVPITEYCDRERMSTRARLELFGRVCVAVQHAHQKGVIHRDLKPSNVLVAEQDGRPVPKVIDFGTAILADRSTDRMGLTEAGTVVGTPEYMSPEQAALSDDIDTATDVYSLGVLLYELLVGSLPFDPAQLRAAGFDEMRRIIRESDPAKPSSRLTGAGAGAAAGAALARQTDAHRLTRQLKGDLDWIVLRALEKDRRRRYATVAAFAADIERSLADQTIDARPPSAAYRVAKFARRHRGAVSAAAALFIVLVAGLLTSLTLYFRAEAASTETSYVAYAATIAAADAELRSNTANSVKDRLLAMPEALRRWEWQHLFLKADVSLRTLSSADECAGERGISEFAPSGNALVLREQATRVFLVRCNTLDRWDAPYVRHATFHADGRILALDSAGDVLTVHQSQSDGTAAWNLQWVDVASGRQRRQFGPFPEQPACADFSPDGARLAIGFKTRKSTHPMHDDAFEIWDVGAARRIVRLAPIRPNEPDSRHELAPCMVAFSSDSKWLASSDMRLRVWRTDTWRTVVRDQVPAGFVSQPIAFSSDGSLLAVGRLDGSTSVIDMNKTWTWTAGGMFISPTLRNGDRQMLAAWRRRDAVLSVAFTSDSTQVVSGNAFGVGLAKTAAGWPARPAQILLGHAAEVSGVGMMAGGQLISSDVLGDVKFWPPLARGAVTVIRGPWTSTGQFALSADGEVIIQSYMDGGLIATRLSDLTQHELVKGKGAVDFTAAAHSLTTNSDGSEVMVGEVDAVGTVRRWTVASGLSTTMALSDPPEKGCEKVLLLRSDSAIDLMAVTPDGKVLAYAQGNCVVVRDLATQKVLRKFPESPSALQFRDDGTILMASFHWTSTVRGPTRIRIWDWRADRILADKPLPISDRGVRLWHLAASRDGRRIAMIGGVPKTVSIWDGTLDHELGRLPVPEDTTAAAFSADGHRLATTTEDASIRIWDVDRLQLVLILTDTDQHNGSIAFTADGRLIASRAGGGVTIWETNRGQLSGGHR